MSLGRSQRNYTGTKWENQKLAVAFVDETYNLQFDTAIKKFHRRAPSEKHQRQVNAKVNSY